MLKITKVTSDIVYRPTPGEEVRAAAIRCPGTGDLGVVALAIRALQHRLYIGLVKVVILPRPSK